MGSESTIRACSKIALVVKILLNCYCCTFTQRHFVWCLLKSFWITTVAPSHKGTSSDAVEDWGGAIIARHSSQMPAAREICQPRRNNCITLSLSKRARSPCTLYDMFPLPPLHHWSAKKLWTCSHVCLTNTVCICAFVYFSVCVYVHGCVHAC